MIVSSPPSQEGRSSVRVGNIGNGQVYAAPRVETPSAAAALSMSPSKTNEPSAGLGKPFVDNSARFRNPNDDERDDALGTKQLQRVAIAPRPEPSRHTIPHWRDAVSQYHAGRSSRRGSGPRPIVAPWISRDPEEPIWRRHFRPGGAPTVPASRSFHPADPRNVPRSGFAPNVPFRGPPHRQQGFHIHSHNQGFRPVEQAAFPMNRNSDVHWRPAGESLRFASVPNVPPQAPRSPPSQNGVPRELPRIVEIPAKVSVRPASVPNLSHSEPPRRSLNFAASGLSQQTSKPPPPIDASSEADSSTTAAAKAPKRILSPQEKNAIFKKQKGFDKLDLLCSATLEIGEMYENPAGCSCPKSKCIALYCDCFKAGRRCNPAQCTCLDCRNTVSESGANGARTKAIRNILARNPRAFQTAGMGNPLLKLPPGEVACNCVRSRCLKLYCSCFHNGKVCRPDVCTCVECQNTEKDEGGHRKAAIEQALEKRPDAFQIKPREKGIGCACKNNRCIRKYCECFRTDLKCTAKCSCRLCENGKPDGTA